MEENTMLSQSYKRQMWLLSAPIPAARSGNADGCFYRRGHGGLFSPFLITSHPSSLQKYEGLGPASVKINSEVRNTQAKNRRRGFQDSQEQEAAGPTVRHLLPSPGGRSSNTSSDLAEGQKDYLQSGCLPGCCFLQLMDYGLRKIKTEIERIGNSPLCLHLKRAASTGESVVETVAAILSSPHKHVTLKSK